MLNEDVPGSDVSGAKLLPSYSTTKYSRLESRLMLHYSSRDSCSTARVATRHDSSRLVREIVATRRDSSRDSSRDESRTKDSVEIYSSVQLTNQHFDPPVHPTF